jgi:hypothetical protein
VNALLSNAGDSIKYFSGEESTIINIPLAEEKVNSTDDEGLIADANNQASTIKVSSHQVVLI